MQDPISGSVDAAKRETAYRLAVGASQPIPVPDTPPERHCDVIMKGGITSGVVYPTAGVELAARYTLKSIGGTSAGAIAAGFFAAAERRRSIGGTAKGFEDLRGYPNKFSALVDGKTPFLQALFRPLPQTRRLFDLLIAFLEKDKRKKPWKILGTVLTRYPLSLLGLAAGVLLFVLGNPSASAALRIAAIVLGVLAALVGFVVASAALVAWDLITKLPKHKFGMCPGSGEAIPGYPRPLSDWIEENLDAIAFGTDTSRTPVGAGSGHRPPGYAPGDPLTFGDLWQIGPGGDKKAPADDPKQRRINLEVITTNLNQGRPYRLPLDVEHLYFQPRELADVFSPRIIAFLVAHARPATNERNASLHQLAAKHGLVPLPLPADLPVAVAVRLSLSFPLLIGAVPLWGFDFTYAVPDFDGKKEEPQPTRCWFSDGGITSNFPIHFFDGPIPRWPTFGFNLTPFHPRFPQQPKEKEALNIWLPNGNGDGQQETWNNPPEKKRCRALSDLSWFLFQVVGTMQNWRDNLQLRIPGFRDRVAQIHQSDEEGGLNLNMDKPRITALSARGRIAAQILAERFSNTPPPQTVLTWNNHAWVRLRSAMGLLESHLAKIETAYAQKEGLDSYAHLIAHPPPAYPFTRPADAAVMLGELEAFARRWGSFGGLLEENVPHPLADLRTMPKI
jgi:predicted acylesterase/phospholipase RssA